MAKVIITFLYAAPLTLALLMLLSAAIRSFRARRLQQQETFAAHSARNAEWYVKRQLLWSRVGEEIAREGVLSYDPAAYEPSPGDGLKELLRKKYALGILLERKKNEHVAEMETLGGRLDALEAALGGRSEEEFEAVCAKEGIVVPEEHR